jgi:hypothetical protein
MSSNLQIAIYKPDANDDGSVGPVVLRNQFHVSLQGATAQIPAGVTWRFWNTVTINLETFEVTFTNTVECTPFATTGSTNRILSEGTTSAFSRNCIV